jgi:lipoprotein-anchoring transpeptidase ErfK/SrfK
MPRNESLTGSVMLLCFGTALLLIPSVRQQFLAIRLSLPEMPALTQSVPPDSDRLQLVVKLSDRRLWVYQEGKTIASYPLAVAEVGWETPTGTFRVTEMQKHPQWRHPITGEVIDIGKNNPLGDRWIGFWSNGRQQIGFHGTNQEELIGQAVSHGCLRMRNRDIRELYQRVHPGTVVAIYP